MPLRRPGAMSWWRWQPGWASSWQGGGGSSSAAGSGEWQSQWWAAAYPQQQVPGGGQTPPGRRPRDHGGWSAQEGSWRRNPLPDNQALKMRFPCGMMAMGRTAWQELREDCQSQWGTRVCIRGRQSTGGRTASGGAHLTPM